jgi:hypothetical protein
MSEVSTVIEAIFRLQPLDGSFSSTALALLAYEKMNAAAPTIKQQEFAYRSRRNIYNTLMERNDALVRLGGLNTFEVGAGDLQVTWSKGSSTKPRLREWLRLRSVIADWLHGLDDTSYELAAGVLMQSLGASRIHVTPHGNDFGIDFLAIVPAHCSNELFVSGSKGVRIVGQSKKYNSAVAREKIQAFNSIMSSIRDNKHELIAVIPGWFRGSSSPLLSCYVAHSGFQSGSSTMAGQHGHVMLDSLQMAEILARSKSSPFKYSDAEIFGMMDSRIRALKAA